MAGGIDLDGKSFNLWQAEREINKLWESQGELEKDVKSIRTDVTQIGLTLVKMDSKLDNISVQGAARPSWCIENNLKLKAVSDELVALKTAPTCKTCKNESLVQESKSTLASLKQDYERTLGIARWIIVGVATPTALMVARELWLLLRH